MKFVWAIPSDSYDFFGFGHRRPYVVLGLLLAACSFAAMILFDPGHYLWAYMLCMILRNIGVAIADCAVDGLSVDCDMDTEAGAIQGWMSLGRTGGTVLAAMVSGGLATQSYQLAVLASAAFCFIPLPANLFIKEEWVDEKAYEDKIDDHATATAIALAAAAAGKEGGKSKQHGGGKSETGGSLSAGCHGGAGMGPVKPASSDDSGSASSGEGSPAPEETAKKLKRRQSFVAKVATSVGFDWDMLEELLTQRHVWMFLLWLALGTLGVALANFSLTGSCARPRPR